MDEPLSNGYPGRYQWRILGGGGGGGGRALIFTLSSLKIKSRYEQLYICMYLKMEQETWLLKGDGHFDEVAFDGGSTVQSNISYLQSLWRGGCKGGFRKEDLGEKIERSDRKTWPVINKPAPATQANVEKCYLS